MAGKLRRRLYEMGYRNYREMFMQDYIQPSLRHRKLIANPYPRRQSIEDKPESYLWVLVAFTLIVFCMVGTIIVLIPIGLIFH